MAQRITTELKRYSIPQAIFAQRVLCRSQGTLSDLLRNPKPWSKLKSGRETFRRMWKWLQEPEFQRMSALRLAGERAKELGARGDKVLGKLKGPKEAGKERALCTLHPVLLSPRGGSLGLEEPERGSREQTASSRTQCIGLWKAPGTEQRGLGDCRGAFVLGDSAGSSYHRRWKEIPAPGWIRSVHRFWVWHSRFVGRERRRVRGTARRCCQPVSLAHTRALCWSVRELPANV